ncbi:hypothetical protein FOA52_009511 [Chlamydomonas sp. UWO 241]|nr:hypothetical protein FOA52_009511 [Chlamydomonas sp. UWO 241]
MQGGSLGVVRISSSMAATVAGVVGVAVGVQCRWMAVCCDTRFERRRSLTACAWPPRPRPPP